MNRKKHFRGIVICFALCFTMLCGGAMIAHAVTPVCGGNHNFCKVRDAGSVSYGNAISHNHDGYYCSQEYKQDMKLERCYCGMERVVPEGGVYAVHHIDYSRKY